MLSHQRSSLHSFRVHPLRSTACSSQGIKACCKPKCGMKRKLLESYEKWIDERHSWLLSYKQQYLCLCFRGWCLQGILVIVFPFTFLPMSPSMLSCQDLSKYFVLRIRVQSPSAIVEVCFSATLYFLHSTWGGELTSVPVTRYEIFYLFFLGEREKPVSVSPSSLSPLKHYTCLFLSLCLPCLTSSFSRDFTIHKPSR